MKYIQIKQIAQKKYKTFNEFCDKTGQDKSNFGTKMKRRLKMVDECRKWLEPLDIEIKFTQKK